MPFKLRSGNTSSFKSMGSSPLKNDTEKTEIAQADANDKFEEKEFLDQRVERRPLRRNDWQEVGEEIREIHDPRGPRLTVEAEDDPNFIGPRQEVVEEHHGKGEDYIVDDGAEEVTRDGDGRIIATDDGEYNPEFNKNKLEYLESEVDDYLDNPMDRASEKSWEIVQDKAWEDTQIPLKPNFDDQENPDPLRHTLAAMYTSEKVGVIPTNILGAMHELTAKNTTQEHKEDLLNNLIGSVIGSVPFTSTKRKEEIVQKLWEKGFLFSGLSLIHI